MPKDRQIGVGLHREAQLRIKAGQTTFQPPIVVLHRGGAVNIGRRAIKSGDGRQIDGLTLQRMTGVVEVMHERKSRETEHASVFRIEKTTSKCRLKSVLRAVLHVCRRLSLPFGPRRMRRGRFGNPRFASFMANNNHKTLDTDLHDAVLRGRKIMRNLFRLALAGGCAWVVLESAKALGVF